MSQAFVIALTFFTALNRYGKLLPSYTYKKENNVIRLCCKLHLILLFFIHITVAQATEIAPELTAVPVFSVHANKTLTNKEILKLEQDERGFIWLGTARGLFRFDGYDYKKITATNDDVDISNIYVRSLYADKTQLWVGTMSSGLFRLDMLSGEVTQFKHDAANPGSLGGNQVNSIKADSAGRLWIAHSFGLDSLDVSNLQFSHYLSADAPTERLFNYLLDIEFDNQQGLWLSTAKGLAIFNTQTQRFSLVHQHTSLGGVISRKIFRASDGRLWLATQKQGSFILDPVRSTVHKLSTASGRENALNTAIAETQDPLSGERVIWISGFEGVEMRSAASGKLLKVLQGNLLDPYGLHGDNVYPLLTLASGELFFGVNHIGLQYYNPNVSRYRYLDKFSDKLKSIFSSVLHDVIRLNEQEVVLFSQHSVVSVNLKTGDVKPFLPYTELQGQELVTGFIDTQGVYWLGGGEGNIFRVDPTQNSVLQFTLPLSKNNGVFVRSIQQSHSGDLWLGTDLGVVKFSPQTQTFSALYNSNGTPFISYSRTLMVDNQDRLWIATNGGVAVVAAKDNTAVFFSKEQGTANSLSHNSIVQIQQNRDGQIMLLTRGGLDLLVEDTAQLKRFIPFAPEVTQQLDSEQHVLQADSGNYWIGSQYLVDSQGQLIARFGSNDGVQEQGRSRDIFALSRDTVLQFFNGGVVIFSADVRSTLPSAAGVAITDVTVGDSSQMLNYQAPQIRVGSDDQQFSLRFASPLYVATSAVQYRYKLQGYDHNWQPSPADIRLATYTALSPGRYQLLLQATDSQGQWPEHSTTISVIVAPKYYQTWWFRLIMLLLAILLLYALFRWRLAVAAQKQRELYEKREALQKARMMTELMEQKNKMLAEVTHDLRTPLAMVKMQLEAMQDGVLQPDEKSYDTLQRRITTLNTMVGDIYQLSVADSGALRLQCKTFDIAKLAQHMTESFDTMMQQKRLRLRFEDYSEGKAQVFADEDRITQVLTNLLKNSYRYTYACGQVCVRVKVVDNTVVLEVADSAPAVTPEELTQLFERLYRAKSSRGGSQSGSGLGLWICQSVIEAHQGTISAALSELGGLSITIELPLANDLEQELLNE